MEVIVLRHITQPSPLCLARCISILQRPSRLARCLSVIILPSCHRVCEAVYRPSSCHRVWRAEPRASITPGANEQGGRVSCRAPNDYDQRKRRCWRADAQRSALPAQSAVPRREGAPTRAHTPRTRCGFACGATRHGARPNPNVISYRTAVAFSIGMRYPISAPAQPAVAADRCAHEIAGFLKCGRMRSRQLNGNPLGGFRATAFAMPCTNRSTLVYSSSHGP